jgi:hypothetical protein
LGEEGFPMATAFYDGKQIVESRLISANIQSDGKLVAVAETQFQTYITTRTTAIEVNQDNSLQVLSSDADFEAIAEVPPHSFPLKPEGMAQGTHFHAWGVRNSMILDQFENPLRPTAIYHRCGERLS